MPIETTEEQEELMLKVINEYWTEFGELIAKHLKRVPREIQDELLARMQEHSSVYGSTYADHMDRETPLMESMRKIMRREV